jgi:transglutaminase-like putative cysteine protease
MDTVPSRPFGYALLREQVSFPAGRKVALTRSFTVRSSSVRGNLKGAMGSWAAYGDLPSTIAAYLKPESTVECHDPQIKLFVDSVLPEGYRRSLSPYEAAKRLFMAVAGRLSYETPADSDALSGLRKHKGDCGTYSSLYVASLRSIGIPARSVCGWRAGKDQWHCWVETYVPGAGWMPQDPTDCNSIWKGNHSSGGFAYCFAIVPDLNSRVVVSRGSTFTTDEGTWHTMQPGQWGIWGDKPKLPTWTSSCSLVPSG